MRLQTRHAIGDLNDFIGPARVVVSAVETALAELAKHRPAWDTLSITVRLDDTFVDQHVVTITALEA